MTRDVAGRNLSDSLNFERNFSLLVGRSLMGTANAAGEAVASAVVGFRSVVEGEAS